MFEEGENIIYTPYIGTEYEAAPREAVYVGRYTAKGAFADEHLIREDGMLLAVREYEIDHA